MWGVFSFPTEAAAQAQPQILYEATDLTNATPGQDLWEYTYFVSGFDFLEGQGWTTFFASTNYSTLEALPSPNSADWDVLVVQPELVLRDPGFYDAQALRNSPSLDLTFRVLFVWLGIGIPGAQPFTFYNPDFSTHVAGETSVPLTLLTSQIVTGPYLPETNTVWTVTNKTFSVPITSGAHFFRLSGPLPTRIVSIRVVGNRIVIKYELIQSASILEPSPSSSSGGEGCVLPEDRSFWQPRDMRVRNVPQHYRKAWLA